MTTIREICRRVFFEATGATTEPEAGVWTFQIEAFFPDAAEVLASRAIAGEPAYRAYLTKTVVLTNVDGTFPLAGHPEIRTDAIPKAVVTHESEPRPLEYLADPSELFYPQPAGVALVTIENQVLRTVTSAGAVDAMTGDLTLRNVVFTPTVAASSGSTTLHPKLEDEFVGVLVEMVRRKLGSGTTEVPA